MKSFSKSCPGGGGMFSLVVSLAVPISKLANQKLSGLHHLRARRRGRGSRYLKVNRPLTILGIHVYRLSIN